MSMDSTISSPQYMISELTAFAGVPVQNTNYKEKLNDTIKFNEKTSVSSLLLNDLSMVQSMIQNTSKTS